VSARTERASRRRTSAGRFPTPRARLATAHPPSTLPRPRAVASPRGVADAGHRCRRRPGRRRG
jgi:hypothetical protein